MPRVVPRALFRDEQDHLNGLRSGNIHGNCLGKPFTGIEAARLTFLRWRFWRGLLPGDDALTEPGRRGR